MGDVEAGFAQSEKALEGEVEIGGQLHFYMETQRCLVVCKDGDELEIYPGSQNTYTTHVRPKFILLFPVHSGRSAFWN